MITQKDFIDWFSDNFGYGYGDGETYIIPALKGFLDTCKIEGNYDYRDIENAIGAPQTWFLMNTLCSKRCIGYGTSPRLGLSLDFGESGKSITLGFFCFLSVYLKLKANFLKGLVPQKRDFGLTMWPEGWLTINLQFWYQDSYDSGKQKGFNGYLRLRDFILGRSKCDVEVLENGFTEIVMPERRYDATYKIERRTWHYRRWPFFKPKKVGYEIEVEEGVPVMGKGENSWDCGMDYTYSIYSPKPTSVTEARKNFVMSILETRQRRGGLDGYLNVPSGRPTKRGGHDGSAQEINPKS